MKQERKEELLRSFPAVPQRFMETMNGRLAENFAVFLTEGKELFVRCFHRYSNGRLVERQRYVFANDGSVRWGKDDGGPWTIRKEFREPVFCQSCYGYNFNNSYKVLNMEAIGQSCMKYCCHELYTGDLLMEYLHLYCRHKNVEYIMKSGYSDLIYEYYTGFWGGIRHICADSHINWKSNNLLKMLGLSRTEFRLLQGREKHYSDYMTWRENYPKLKPPDLLLLAEQFGCECGTMVRFTDATGLTPQRIALYLSEHDVAKRDYSDYLRQCAQLKYNLHDTAISMPHDFMAMHTRCSEMIRHNESQEARLKFKENMAYRRQLEFASCGLFIRQPKNMTEIVQEGAALHHCVGGYAERHAKGALHIMFIRTAEKPDVPYYTMEISTDGKIVQVRGLRNCNPTAAVKALIAAYTEYLAGIFGKQQKVRKTA